MMSSLLSLSSVLNDEVSRKYIQSLKRLMTFAQTKVSCIRSIVKSGRSSTLTSPQSPHSVSAKRCQHAHGLRQLVNVLARPCHESRELLQMLVDD